MKHTRTWPSRRLQLIVIAALIIGAALRVFWQPLTPQGKAEKLYTDSWFAGRGDSFSPEVEGHGAAAILLLEKALKLAPGNSQYEQALVWQYDPKKLPELLRRHHLGPKALRLAAGRIADEPVYHDIAPDGKRDIKADAREELQRLNALQKADPTNSLVHYRKAYALQEMGRKDEAYAELKAGNRLGPIKFHYPHVSREVADSLVSPLTASPQFSAMMATRRLAMAMSDLANDRLRQGKVQEARAILESCMPMSVNVARSEPPTIIAVLVGIAVFRIGTGDLEPIYKDFGMKDKVAQLRRLDAAYDRALRACKAETAAFDWERPIAMSYAILVMLVGTAVVGSVLPVLFALFWVTAAIMRRRCRQDVLSALPWSKGFLARMLLALYLPLFALSIAAASWGTTLFFPGDTVPGMDAGPIPAAAIILVQLCIMGLALRVLHHRYDEHTGERTGVLRFIFKAPANAKAWTRKHVMAALGAQLIFLACCFLLAIIVYKPIFGGHPWQVNRFRVSYSSHEQAAMARVGEDLRKASLALPPWEKQKEWR